ncbi:hypothetical protein P3T23_004500 [Paraburkholderia sp. GAS448]|uniref:HNH endonuclease signature motif containing protein n=1 Tax=Paraburkholderia sp. GAS448 TaxID=3035136 RepID=UPI003D20568E
MGQNPKDRDYRKEYLRDHASPAQKKDRATRNAARRTMEDRLGSAAIAGRDVDHIRRLKGGGTNAPSNLRVMSVRRNRGRNN